MGKTPVELICQKSIQKSPQNKKSSQNPIVMLSFQVVCIASIIDKHHWAHPDLWNDLGDAYTRCSLESLAAGGRGEGPCEQTNPVSGGSVVARDRVSACCWLRAMALLVSVEPSIHSFALQANRDLQAKLKGKLRKFEGKKPEI